MALSPLLFWRRVSVGGKYGDANEEDGFFGGDKDGLEGRCFGIGGLLRNGI